MDGIFRSLYYEIVSTNLHNSICVVSMQATMLETETTHEICCTEAKRRSLVFRSAFNCINNVEINTDNFHNVEIQINPDKLS